MTVNKARLQIKREQQRLVWSKIALLFTRQVVLPHLSYNNDAITRRSRRNDRTSREVMRVREANDLVRNNQADGNFS